MEPPPLEYEKSADRPRRWSRWVLILTAALALLPVLLPVGCVTVLVVRTRIESRKFHEAFPENQILGQSFAAVRARYGQPDFLKHNPDGTALLTYASHTTWESCGIEFRDDKATKVFFWAK